jgi:sulfatase maturation enzyme AslB (radical SAM superfamily)
VKELFRSQDADAIEEAFPLFCTLFVRETKKLHLREIHTRDAEYYFVGRCFPGATRTFCSSSGGIYPCEKIETGGLFKLGAAGNAGVDNALRLTEVIRLLGDCANCVAKNVCELCPVAISQLDSPGRADALSFQRRCRKVISGLPAQLEEYTFLMEMNPEIIDRIIPRRDQNGWLDDITVLPTERQLREMVQANELVEESL